MGYEEFSAAMANRSLRTIKSELEFLAEASIITQQQLDTILANLPATDGARTPVPGNVAASMNALSFRNNAPTSPQPAQTPLNEKQNHLYNPAPVPAAVPPPAYAASPPPAPAALCQATALYAYAPTDDGDLALQPNDRIAVLEYMNAEWWKGRSGRTGQEGIFPRTYVRVEESKGAAPAAANAMTSPPPANPRTGSNNPMSYGNMPLAVSQGGSGSAPGGVAGGRGGEQGKKFGKKMGNAAIFGAGSTVGSKIVNGIF